MPRLPPPQVCLLRTHQGRIGQSLRKGSKVWNVSIFSPCRRSQVGKVAASWEFNLRKGEPKLCPPKWCLRFHGDESHGIEPVKKFTEKTNNSFLGSCIQRKFPTLFAQSLHERVSHLFWSFMRFSPNFRLILFSYPCKMTEKGEHSTFHEGTQFQQLATWIFINLKPPEKTLEFACWKKKQIFSQMVVVHGDSP